MNALADPETGKYINGHFVSAFQKVGTFRIIGDQKQGGNVATYFCAPDGRVLHIVAGPVDGETLRREATWVVESVRRAMRESHGDGGEFKALFRRWHAERLREHSGLIAEPATFDAPTETNDNDALTYRDPSGRPLVAKLPPPPIDGPDVTLARAQELLAGDKTAAPINDRRGRRWALDNQGRVHLLLTGHALTKIETIYGSVFENILGERVTTRPVELANPFPWATSGNR